jgi:hypothetical protein
LVCVGLVDWRELRLGGSGVGGAVSLFTRDDFLTPVSKTVVGPSAANDLHGGDTARDAGRLGVPSSSLRRFDAREMTPPSSPVSAVGSSFIAGTVSSLAAGPSWWAWASASALVASAGGRASMSASADVTSSIQ